MTLRVIIAGPHRHHIARRQNRGPEFVSPSSNGLLAQVYRHGAAHTPANVIAQSATDISSGSPACGGQTGFPRTCTAKLNLPPTGTTTDDLVAMTYDAAPSGGGFTGAHLLGIGQLLNQAIVAGTKNQKTIFLGGVVASLGGNPATIVLTANGSAQQVAIVIDPQDYGGNPITAGSSDPLANPIAVSVSENGGSGHTLMSLNGGTPASSVQVSKTTDSVELDFDGKSPAGYTAGIQLSASQVAGGGGASENARLAPFALSSSNGDYHAPTLALRGNGDELTLTVGRVGAQNSTTYSATPSNCNAIAQILPVAGSGSSATFSILARATVSNGGCTIDVTDGTYSINVAVTNTYSGILGTPAIAQFSSGLSTGQHASDITVGPDGAMWFTELSGKLGRIPATGSSPAITETTLPINAGTPAPTGVTTGPDGNLWWASPTGNVGMISTSGSGSGYAHGGPSGASPTRIVTGSDGALWFSDGQCPGQNAIV
ncbi:MAG: hypothetical protein JO277_10305, partial [Candidatus Eremiobacteraeota bacterium]|nr:hypothetical protein [Candidatus Eremiobacteraeota bacterium]